MMRLGGIAAIAIVTMLIAGTVDARPQYPKAIGKHYPASADALKAAKCGACHGAGGKKKKILSDYGKILKEALGEKNVKDADKIMAAIKAAGEKKEGEKTYDELLKAGKLPKPADE